MTDSEIIPQEKMMALTIPILKQQGALYRKFKAVWAKKALGGEKIITKTSDGIETANIANAGDFIVINQTQSQEEYIVGAGKFQQRYRFDKDLENEFAEYHPLGKVIAIEITENVLKSVKLRNHFQFTAPWGTPSMIKQNDFLACPLDFSEVYRIARKEFFETYEVDSEANE